jgi:hypothetical protein
LSTGWICGGISGGARLTVALLSGKLSIGRRTANRSGLFAAGDRCNTQYEEKAPMWLHPQEAQK